MVNKQTFYFIKNIETSVINDKMKEMSSTIFFSFMTK